MPPLSVVARVDVVEHHALREQPRERLVDLHEAQVAHHLGPEARVQQVQDGVLDAADVLVHRHPVVVRASTIAGRCRVAVAHEVPGRIDEGVHRVGLAPRRLAALRAGDVQEVARTCSAGCRCRRGCSPRAARPAGPSRAPAPAAVVAMDDRDRRAPVALAADAPVAQAPPSSRPGPWREQSAAIASTACCRRGRRSTPEFTQRRALVGVPLLPGVGRRSRRRRHATTCGSAARTSSRTRSRARRAPARPSPRRRRSHQHVVADPHLDLRAGQRVRDVSPVGTPFFSSWRVGLGHRRRPCIPR
jgi:hypothetical protein